MDTKNEDKIVRQIEKSLSNNMNENLFLSGRAFENRKNASMNHNAMIRTDSTKGHEPESKEYPLVSNDYINDSQITISRAEYIRQAREACLRQLSNAQVYSRPYDVNYMDYEAINSEQLNKKKAKAWKLFHEDLEHPALAKREENTPQEIADFRSLIIRTVCAIVLFLSIFMIDRFDIKVGRLNKEIIQEYVTGNDSLKELENIIVTWLK